MDDSSPAGPGRSTVLYRRLAKIVRGSENEVRVMRFYVLFSLLLLTCLAIFMLWLTWFRWGDPLIDHGEELYLPWQILEGRILYRDLDFARGPFTPYLNAAIFWLTGPSFASLAGFNILLTLAVAALIYVFFLRRGGVISATATTSSFMLLFAFAQYERNGTYNFVTPYSNESTHAIFLAFVCINALDRFLGARKIGWLALAAFCCGLTFLTKPELFLALTVAFFLALFVDWVRSPEFRERAGVFLRTAFCAMALPLFAAWLMLWSQMPAQTALSGIFRGWVYMWEIRELMTTMATPLARWSMGLNDIGGNLWRIAVELCIYAIVFAAAFALNLKSKGHLRHWAWAPVFYLGLTLFLLQLPISREQWLTGLRALPVVTLGFLVFWAYRCSTRQDASGADARAIGTLALTAYAQVMLLRMMLNARVDHYGFTLALPAVLLFVHAAVYLGSQLAARSAGRRDFYLAVMAACMTAWMYNHVAISRYWFSNKDYTIASTFKTFSPAFDRKGPIVNDALKWLQNHTDPDTTLTVFPEGAMINFLSKRKSPLRFTTFNPVTFLQYGDQAIVDALAMDRPDYILLVHRNNREHGARFFGIDFARETRTWIDQHYTHQATFGQPPFTRRGFGIAILARNPSTLRRGGA